MKVAIFGAGKIGFSVVQMLLAYNLIHPAYSADQKFEIRVGERDPDRLSFLRDVQAALGEHIDKSFEFVALADHEISSLAPLLEGVDVLLNAGPHFANENLIKAAVKHEVHYLDLTEDVSSAALARQLSDVHTKLMIPQCGLAPGYISIVANALINQLTDVTRVKLRVGALPQHPDNRLKYYPTWSVDGLVNEYLNPGKARRDGLDVLTEPLGDVETLQIQGVDYEAFNTSGGLGSLMELNAVPNIDYKTLRYPGHVELVKTLLELKLDRADLLKIFNALPKATEDVVVTYVSVEGTLRGEKVRKTEAKVIRGSNGTTAIEKTTAGGVCAILQLLLQGQLPERGFFHVETVDYELFKKTFFYETYYA